MTAGSCSVMLVWPTRRTRFCHGSEAGSGAGLRRGKGASRNPVAGMVASAGLWPGIGGEGSSARKDSVNGRAAAPVVSPVFRNVLRLNIEPFREKRTVDCSWRQGLEGLLKAAVGPSTHVRRGGLRSG